MTDTEEFDTLAFEKKLMQLQGTQESIQGLSAWCLKRKDHHKKIVQSWLNVLKRVKIDQRLVLFYLANDVIQYSKRKNYDFVESWGLNLQKATPLVRDEKVRPKILRIFKIWEQRLVYDEDFLSDLNGLLSAGAVKRTDDDSSDFQPQQLINKIKQCAVLEADTDQKLKNIHDCPLDLDDMEELCTTLKERCHKDDVLKEVTEGASLVERYTQSLQREIVAREALLALLTSANQYYSMQRGEVKIVAYAYKSFGARVRTLQRKLDELIPKLNSAPSPPRDAPSPGPEDDIQLPGDSQQDISYNIDKTFNTSLSADGSLYNLGLSSFLGSDNPMALFNESTEHVRENESNNKIEVISSQKHPDFDINSFLKSFAPIGDNASDNISVSSGISQPLPGLEPVPEVPVTLGSFYGTNDETDVYGSNPDSPWSAPQTPPLIGGHWNVPPPAPVPAPVPAPAPAPVPAPLHRSPPQSPPPMPIMNLPPPTIVKEIPAVDVDHRGLLPPPPPPPVLPLLGQMEDVDHRMLPSLPPPPPPPVGVLRNANSQDIDHRNLISLTQQPPPRPIRHENPRPLRHDPVIDQDYRVPPPVGPTDIVESVDMDLSEDEERGEHSHDYDPEHRHFQHQNNKVLVGGHNGKTNLDPRQNFNRSLSTPEKPYRETLSPPPPITAMPPPPFGSLPPRFEPPRDYNYRDEEAIDANMRLDPRRDEEEWHDDTWQQQQNQPRFQTHQHRFPRNWSPGVRTNTPRPFWPRNGPRPPNRPWMGPRPNHKFW